MRPVGCPESAAAQRKPLWHAGFRICHQSQEATQDPSSSPTEPSQRRKRVVELVPTNWRQSIAGAITPRYSPRSLTGTGLDQPILCRPSISPECSRLFCAFIFNELFLTAFSWCATWSIPSGHPVTNTTTDFILGATVAEPVNSTTPNTPFKSPGSRTCVVSPYQNSAPACSHLMSNLYPRRTGTPIMPSGSWIPPLDAVLLAWGIDQCVPDHHPKFVLFSSPSVPVNHGAY